MAFSTRPVDGKSILVQTLEPGFRGAEMSPMFAQASAALDAMPAPVIYILDIQATDIRFGDVVQGASLATSGDRPAFHHPHVLETLIVTGDPVLRLAAEGLAAPQYGGVKVRIFDTLEQAISYSEQRLSGV